MRSRPPSPPPDLGALAQDLSRVHLSPDAIEQPPTSQKKGSKPHKRKKKPGKDRNAVQQQTEDHVGAQQQAKTQVSTQPKPAHAKGSKGIDESRKIPPVPATRKRDELLNLLPRPIPTDAYLQQANQAPVQLPKPRLLLVVLDLNGTLLYRIKRGGANEFLSRPHVDEFLAYLFTNHRVVVWSSARPFNVRMMLDRLFPPLYTQKTLAVWTRDDLRLARDQYNRRVQVYKQLSWLWADKNIGRRSKVAGLWSQANTVLIDDSTDKAASEPYNLLRIEEYTGAPAQNNDTELPRVQEYLERLASQSDVSAYMRIHPYGDSAPGNDTVVTTDVKKTLTE